jgi:NAD(P)-dependent dehydrogenase (short-subunit alcohol dehydrogenase family)
MRRRRHALDLDLEQPVGEHVAPIEQRRVLEDDAQIGDRRGHVLPEHRHRTGGCRHEPGDDPRQCHLSVFRWADNGQELPRPISSDTSANATVSRPSRRNTLPRPAILIPSAASMALPLSACFSEGAGGPAVRRTPETRDILRRRAERCGEHGMPRRRHPRRRPGGGQGAGNRSSTPRTRDRHRDRDHAGFRLFVGKRQAPAPDLAQTSDQRRARHDRARRQTDEIRRAQSGASSRWAALFGSPRRGATADKRSPSGNSERNSTTGLDNHWITLPRQGAPLLDFGYASFGVNAVGLQIHNHDDTIKNNADLVRRFVKATVRAFNTAMANPAASIRAGQKAKSDLETDLGLEQLKVGISLMPSKASNGKPVGYMAPEDFRRLVEVNLTRSFIVARVAAVAMIARPQDGRAGRIVLMGSIQGKERMALAKSMAKELAREDITIDVVSPVAAQTAMARQITQARRADILSRIPAGRFVELDGIASVIACPCPPEASSSTGAVFDLSGERAGDLLNATTHIWS